MMLTMGAGLPAQAASDVYIPPACWFYKYQWAYFRMIRNVAPPTSYATAGDGTGMMVTDGTPPNDAEKRAIVDDIVQNLPRGDLEAPPPRAFVQGFSRIACPKAITELGLSMAKIRLRQPEPKR